MARILGTISSSFVEAAGDFESIATATVGSGGASEINFNSISADWTHLQIRTFSRRSGSTGSTGINLRFNGDESANYVQHYIEGDGSGTISSGSNLPLTLAGVSDVAGGNTTANVFAVGVVDILDYASSSKFKTIRGLSGVDINGSGFFNIRSALWRSTSAVTSINLSVSSGFAQYSHFALYGIKVE